MELLPPIPNDASDRKRDSERFCASPPVLDQFLDLHQVIGKTGNKSKSSIYQEIRDGTFPAPVPIGKGRVAWVSSELLFWQRGCIEARRKAAEAHAISNKNKKEKDPTPAKEAGRVNYS